MIINDNKYNKWSPPPQNQHYYSEGPPLTGGHGELTGTHGEVTGAHGKATGAHGEVTGGIWDLTEVWV